MQQAMQRASQRTSQRAQVHVRGPGTLIEVWGVRVSRERLLAAVHIAVPGDIHLIIAGIKASQLAHRARAIEAKTHAARKATSNTRKTEKVRQATRPTDRVIRA